MLKTRTSGGHPFLSARARAGKRSAALIITLAILCILSITLLAYIWTVSSDRQQTQNYSQGLKAEDIAEGGLAFVVGQLRAEMTDPSLSTNFFSVSGGASNFIYRPLAPSNAVPEQMVIPALTADSGLANVVKISLPGAPLFDSPTAGSANTNLASSVPTTTPSLNGRYISTARWSKPVLLPSTETLPVPNWVFVGRGGPFVPSGSGFSSSLANPNAVLGRYAFVVYDTSGLIDANVAGFSPGEFPAPAAAAKGLAPWIDLTQLGGGDIDAFVKWRNARSAASASTYSAYVTNAMNNGFLQVTNGDTAFLGRQELIKYAQLQNPGLTSALPYLTTFSRELNGPTWGPTTNGIAVGVTSGTASPYDYVNHQYGSTVTSANVTMVSGQQLNTSGTPLPTVVKAVQTPNVFILKTRVQQPYTNFMGIPRLAGEPLVKYRFPLQKLALLEKAQGPGTLTSQDISDIQRYFGLDYAGDSAGYYRHWTYPTTSTLYTHTAGRILTLDEVAALGRDPDFFELLYAGILTGSLATSGRGDQSLTTNDPDISANYQIVRIGANIIDQWDADSYPTTITFNSQNFYGVEDLPYINEYFIKPYSPTAMTGAEHVGNVTVYGYYELWNPHQNLNNSTSRPTNFRIVPTANDYYRINVVGSYPAVGVNPSTPVQWTRIPLWIPYAGTGVPAVTSPGNKLYFTDMTSANLAIGGIIKFTAAVNDYREPALLTGTGNTLPSSVVGSGNVLGYNYGTLSLPATNTVPSSPSPAAAYTGSPYVWPLPAGGKWQVQCGAVLTSLLQWEDPSGNYHAYSSLAGFDTTGTDSGALAGNYEVVSSSSSPNSYSLAKSDPRTTRLAANFAASGYANAGTTLTPSGNTIDDWVEVPSFGYYDTTLQPYRIDMFAVNDSTVPILAGGTSGRPPYYADQDGIMRPGDMRFSYAQSSGMPFYPADSSRPIILNRPFQSVGELGYAFRDSPWKTIDFSSPVSGDAGLLDLFCLGNAPVVAGHINPNVAPAPVDAAVLNGGVLTQANTGTLTAAQATTLATQFRAAVVARPLVTRADLVNTLMTNSAVTNAMPSNLKMGREALVRSYGELGNTRTWNFLVDIIAQSGRYPAGSGPTGSGDTFVVEGERRYWLHIAIDRYTGQVIDQQLEVVNE
jgi:hypothetical protein